MLTSLLLTESHQPSPIDYCNPQLFLHIPALIHSDIYTCDIFWFGKKFGGRDDEERFRVRVTFACSRDRFDPSLVMSSVEVKLWHDKITIQKQVLYICRYSLRSNIWYLLLLQHERRLNAKNILFPMAQ